MRVNGSFLTLGVLYFKHFAVESQLVGTSVVVAAWYH
jgi:hypothetical protein